MPAQSFNRTLREAAQDLIKKKGGLRTFAFESKSLAELEKLQPNSEVKMMFKRSGIEYLPEFGSQPYEETTIRTERIRVQDMLKEGQLEEEGQEKREPVKPRKGYYRRVVIYLPDPYLRSYQVWAQYGGVKKGRRRFEKLTSSFL